MRGPRRSLDMLVKCVLTRGTLLLSKSPTGQQPLPLNACRKPR